MKKIISLMIIVLSMGISAKVYADGGFIYEGFAAEAEKAQQAIVMFDSNSGMERLYLSVALEEVAPANACWLIATPGLPAFTEISNLNIYQVLKQKSDPQLNYTELFYPGYDGYYGCGCLAYNYQEEPTSAYDEGDASYYDPGTVTIWYGITNMDYTAIVFSATDTNIVEWLTNEGFYLDASYETVLDGYASQNWYFTAIRFTDFASDKTIFSRLEFATDDPVFPLTISSINSAPYQDLQIFFVSQYRAVTTNYSVLQVPIYDVEYLGSDYSGYDEDYYSAYGEWNYYEVLNTASQANNYEAIFTEYAGRIYLSSVVNDYNNWGEYEISEDEFDDVVRDLSFVSDKIWVTRFYLRVPPNKMTDIYFEPGPDSPVQIYKRIEVDNDSTNVYYEENYYVRDDFLRGLAGTSAEMGILFIPIGFILIKHKKKRKKS